jgi:signal transduction histidine kinase
MYALWRSIAWNIGIRTIVSPVRRGLELEIVLWLSAPLRSCTRDADRFFFSAIDGLMPPLVAAGGVAPDGEESVCEGKAEDSARDGSIAGVLRDDEQLHARAAELTELSRHLIQVAEEEKADLARELHDTFGSNLTAINMDLNWIAKRLPPERPELRDRLERALRMLRETVAVKQDVIDRLRPSQLDTLGLAVALRSQCRELTTRTGVPCEVDAPEEFDGLDRTWSIALYRIAQEALANVEKHAEAASVFVDLVREDRGIRLRIRDDGIGLAQGARHAPDSHGLVGMRERIAALGGILQVTATGDRGTLVDAFIPHSLHA